MGRKKIYVDDVARQRAFRERTARLDLAITKELDHTLEQISIRLNVPKAALCVSFLKFALTNRDWVRLGLTHQDST